MTSAFERGLRDACRPQSLKDLAAAGVSAEMTRSKRWRRSSRGFFVPSDAPHSTAQRILEATPLLPERGAFAGWAAAYALGVDLLDGLDALTMTALPVPIHLGQNLGRATPSGLRLARERLPVAHRRLAHGLPVTSPMRTAFDGGRWAADLVEAVVFLDQVAHALEVDLLGLEPWCRPGARWPGIKQLRAALTLADSRSASPWESRLRMFYQRQAGLPRPLVNRPVFDLDDNFLGTPDLFDPDAGLATEFDGKDHREGVNLTVCRVDSLDMRQPLPLRERLRARHLQGLRRDRSLDRWTLVEPPWWQHRRRAA